MLWRERLLWQQVICHLVSIKYFFPLLLILKRRPCNNSRGHWITKCDLITYDQTGLQRPPLILQNGQLFPRKPSLWVCGALEINCSSISLIIISIIGAGCLYYHVNKGTCQVTAGRSWGLVNRGDQIKQLSNPHMWVCQETHSGIR